MKQKPMIPTTNDVIIVGGGLAGLACAVHLQRRKVAYTLLEADTGIGGRIKTDTQNGFLLDRGFQVLQTAYPEARRMLDYRRLNLKAFAPGVKIRFQKKMHTVADPLRRPNHLIDSLAAPIGTLADRMRLVRLSQQATNGRLDSIFKRPESTAMAFLRDQGFSTSMIERFFVPFFGGVCLDPQIKASSRVLLYVMRMFAKGNASIPANGMEMIPQQLAEGLSARTLHTGVRVRQIQDGRVILDDGTTLAARAVVVATDGPAARKLLDLTRRVGSISEACLYFSAPLADWHSTFLMLNGEGTGPINNIAIPSRVSPQYAPGGRSLISAVVLGMPKEDDARLIKGVKTQLTDWFGREAESWQFIAIYRIDHALPDQSPPTKDPNRTRPMIRPGVFVCGEIDSLPGIQWALLSGRRAANAVTDYLQQTGTSHQK